ncbi:MFS family permease [Rhizomicrobium palustre]|uniref:MFS family permease n=1 Tax=Rhizomicrobium palustre TaxID=189966 RepID=A0A846MZF1_9PROT|nr:MFS transporter [Rhizomicrobium palustre]NIK88693.1 MFS family permease [Rhizomicrobium palustre]
MSDPTVYRHRDFILFASSRFLSTVAMMVQSVAIGWQIYEIERTPLALGLVGLCQFLPMFLFTLPAGEMTDRFDQRRVLSLALLLQGLCAAIFLTLSITGIKTAVAYYAVLVLFGVGRGFASPAGQSLTPFLVPPERLPRAIALNSSVFTTAVIAGPAMGGFLYAFGPEVTYSLCLAFFVAASAITAIIGGRRRAKEVNTEMSRFERVVEGIRFVKNRPVILGAISLDLFAVLLGGATALLPLFARDILHTGPWGLGLLRSAPAVGAALVALALTGRPIERNIGVKMFAAVAVFGVATIVFGLSSNFYLSMGALFVLGASDMISVFVRQSLVSFATPDEMRGRVGAVNMLFIGASNELGEFESGITAALFGSIPAVIIGGLGTLGVVAIWMKLFPPLRDVDRLKDIEFKQA